MLTGQERDRLEHDAALKNFGGAEVLWLSLREDHRSRCQEPPEPDVYIVDASLYYKPRGTGKQKGSKLGVMR